MSPKDYVSEKPHHFTQVNDPPYRFPGCDTAAKVDALLNEQVDKTYLKEAELRIRREAVKACHIYEGVNSAENCKEVRMKYLRLIWPAYAETREVDFHVRKQKEAAARGETYVHDPEYWKDKDPYFHDVWGKNEKTTEA